MADKKKFDNTQLIGILLIGAIVLWMFYSKPEPTEEVVDETTTEQVDTSTTTPEKPIETPQETVVETTLSDSLQQVQKQNRLGAFAYATAKDGITTVSNDVLELKVNNKGGYIVEAKLLQHKTYDSIPVYLIKDGNSAVSYTHLTLPTILLV